MAAIEEAVAMINAKPDKLWPAITNRDLLPSSMLDAYTLPVYPAASVPKQNEWTRLVTWAKSAGLISIEIPYGLSVTSDFLP